MFHTYVNFEKELLVTVDFTNGFHTRIAEWLELYHRDLYYNIGFQFKGKITVDPDYLKISGDNGFIILTPVVIQEI